MPSHRSTRRTFTATAAGFAAGAFATSHRVMAAQEATAVAGSGTPVTVTTPAGYVSVRTRTVESLEARNQVNQQVVGQFVANVEGLEGFKGYALGDVTDQPEQSLSILVLEEERHTAGFDEIAAEFVGGLEETVTTVDTVQWEGDLLISAGPGTGVVDATPVATPSGGRNADGHIAMRVHTGTPGTDPREFVPLATSSFVPILVGLAGFRGYLWFPVEGGFVTISVFESEASAKASNDAARDWVAEFITEYTDGNPEIINAQIVYANMPIFADAG